MKRVQVDLRLLAAAAFAVAAGVAVHAATRPPATVDAIVAVEHVAPGTPLGDVALETRALPPLQGLVTADQLEQLAGHTVAASLAAGDPVLLSLLSPSPGSRPDVAALTLDPSHAVQGDLVAGDRVDVYVTALGTTTLLASNVLIVAAGTPEGSLASSGIPLLLAVDRDLARTLLEAVHTAEIDLVRRAR